MRKSLVVVGLCALIGGCKAEASASGSTAVDGGPDGAGGASACKKTPTPLTGVTSISAGDACTCAVMKDKTARCWGSDSLGGLGISKTATPQVVPFATPVLDLTNIVQIAAGSNACALLGDNSVRCWGTNQTGELGDGTKKQSLTPVTAGVTNVKQITVAAFDACAVSNDGSVHCWGNDQAGEVGDGQVNAQGVPTPIVPTGVPSTIEQVSIGDLGACALLQDGSVMCWGENDSGYLGIPGTDKAALPAAVLGLSGVAEIGVGQNYECARLSDGTVECWGAEWALGNGTTAHTDPQPVTGLTNAAHLSVGDLAACVLFADGTAKCWGQNDNGELGDGTTDVAGTPVAVAGLSNATAIVQGGDHTCALLQDTSVVCWGANNEGQLGDGTTTERHSPAPVMVCPP